MPNLSAALIRLQIPLSHICPVSRPINKHVIPRLILRRATPRHLVVPFLGSRKLGVDVVNDSSIPKKPMLHQLPNVKLRVNDHQSLPAYRVPV